LKKVDLPNKDVKFKIFYQKFPGFGKGFFFSSFKGRALERGEKPVV